MRAYDGRIFRLDEHLARLDRALGFLEIHLGAGASELAGHMEELARRNGLADAYVRLTVTRGTHTGDLSLAQKGASTVVAYVRQAPGPNRVLSLHQASARISSSDPTRRFKTTNYLVNLLLRAEALKQGFSDAVILNERGHVCETTTANLFVISGTGVSTPPLSANILDGITRSVVMDICGSLGVDCREELFGLEAIESADEVFATNSIGEVMPVEKWEARPIPAPGRLTQRILEAYKARVREETRC